jgi:hypothetical protein
LIYVAVIVIAALAGIARLSLIQRRERVHLQTAEGFFDSLEKISHPTPPLRSRPMRVSGGRPASRVAPLDPARRAAAKRRIEARRRARS